MPMEFLIQYVLFSASVTAVAFGPPLLVEWYNPGLSSMKSFLMCVCYSIFAAILWKLRRTISDLIALVDEERIKALQAAVAYGVIAEKHPEKTEEFRTHVEIALQAMLSREPTEDEVELVLSKIQF